jgi:hypothetical protein
MCQDDVHAAWCMGYPATNDPQFTPYVPNLDTYLTWGPLNLAQAQAAGASFWLLNRSEPAHDSIFWGAALSRQLTSSNMMLAGSYSGDMTSDWELKYMDFTQLRSPTGDTVSYLGQSAIYLFWRFRSDGNANNYDPLRFGAIIDNITVSLDDGGVNLSAGGGSMLQMDGTPWAVPVEGDSTYARFDWNTCNGGSGVYPPFRVMALLDNGTVVLDTTVANAAPDSGYSFFTHPWVLAADSHFVRFVLDTLNEVHETDETDNTLTVPYFVPPVQRLQFRWITPDSNGNGASGDQSITLRWEVHSNPEIPATLTFSSSTQGAGCQGILIPGGTARPVTNGVDSLVWDLSQYPYGVPRYVFARWHDNYTDSCIYAPHTIVRLDVDRPQGGLIPDHFYLAQNYPNPFNPSTGLEYGVTKSGHVTLKVFDVLGREVAVLVNGQRAPGVYRALFDGARLPSGLYLYNLTTPEGTQTRKMMLMK